MQKNEQANRSVTLDQLTVGTVITYRLRPDQCPTNAQRKWRGRIVETFLRRGYLLDIVLVDLLEPGYEDEMEAVLLDQIVEVERA